MRFPSAVLVAALALIQCREAPVRTRNWFAMSTNLSATLVGEPRSGDDSAFAVLERETARLGDMFTDFSETSALSSVKGRAGDTVVLDPEIFSVLEHAVEMGTATLGGFDITLHDLKWAWGLAAGQTGQVPDSATLDSLLKGNPTYRSGWDSAAYRPPLTLLPPDRAVLRRDGTQLDLGAVAKGYIVDRLHGMLDSLGLPDHILQAGGDIRVGGRKPSGPWRIGVRNPRNAGGLSGMITLSHPFSVSTSGDYERYFEQAGMRYHHIFDPRTGRPSRNAMAVTVVADSSVLADALSTSLFVLGPERGAILARRFHASAAWYREIPGGMCAVVMEEMRGVLELKGISACGAD
jgi:FAD:protein FMN transferase